MVKSEKSKDLQKRIAILNDFFQYMLYCNVARSLFEKDKMLLSLLICTTNMRREGHFDEQEWRFFLAGPSSTSKVPEPNTSKWLSDKLWNEMVKLSKFPAFSVRFHCLCFIPSWSQYVYFFIVPYMINDRQTIISCVN